MSTYILMKILESAPTRYDRGIRMLTFGRLDNAYDRLTSHIGNGQRVLDLGCGTGALTILAAQKGAHVVGIDINPGMLEIARKKAKAEGLEPNIQLREMGVAELGGEEPASFDVVMSGLCFSELTEEELIYALRETKRILKPGGLLLIADEVRSKAFAKRLLTGLIRFPLLVITYVLTQTTTHAVQDLPERIEQAGLRIEMVTLSGMEDFIEVLAQKPDEVEK
jgi:ubiquinone/menaquinone biosynthesis C-methylase UbiE